MRAFRARALTVAGSDSGGGAGIQADLKTFAALGVHGMCAITAITAQNTVGVYAVQDVDVEVIRSQIRVVAEDIGVDAVKTGMLHTSQIIEAVAEELSKLSKPIVVDPVMVAKSGAELLKQDAVKSLIEKMLPIATVLTPNALEASKLVGFAVKTLEDAKRAARAIAEMGPRAVVVKGGHILSEKSVDTLYYDGEVRLIESPRVNTKNTHGTGCVFASAIAAEMAKGADILSAVSTAKQFVLSAIKKGTSIGKGHGPVNPSASVYEAAMKFEALECLKEAVRMLESNPAVARLIPESQSNIAMAIPYAESREEVVAIPGRMVRLPWGVRASGCPEFGASRHVADAILTVMEYNPNVRAAMNVRLGEDVLDAVRSLNLSVSRYDRRLEPEEVKRAEGMSVRWGMSQAVKLHGGVPNVVYHEGDWGKEPMVTVFGRDAVEVASLVIRLAEKIR
ncbi:MAG: bifunctional hydroxymethylpyrimidine kinase/phosphomethylpyrimidine kinase [Candidatus Terraquivivens tikiterensis]|uniref:Bifunctional hydroxymethylpyrimidine kinase/phosphomethylpyrimidine kinase n=1 Tax=Candidatus Terraquivivens tikiterensis TaxID=1980982 RepID=A0A2R7Y5D3_9ARCH|nr:MAG: bifunctional hydroxymethylpyrimidine kinase/phosphomethylpyrimidine kinase [Candidatus Terraquivivens tikiterensis]